jgi:hypothetical protein
MGWFGHGIYDGDDTQTQHYTMISVTGCATEDEIYAGDWIGWKTKIPSSKIQSFIDGIPKILKKMPACKFFNVDKALKWQMLLALFVDNKISPPDIIKRNGLLATEYLMGEDADDFTSPSGRRRVLRRFIKKVNTMFPGEII